MFPSDIKKRPVAYVLPFIFLLTGMAIGFFIRGIRIDKDGNRAFYVKREGEYRFINPLLECDTDQNVMRNRELRPFKDSVENVLANTMRNRGVTSAAVYFRELNDGLWFSIGDTERFTPASMRKVPLMIAIFKMSERDHGLPARKVVHRLKQDYNAYQNIKPSQAIEPGREYTVADLVSRMIVYSDNNAFMLLTGIVDPLELDREYSLLSIRNPADDQSDDYMSIQTYASFFRILYNATFLTRDLSDVALEFLSRTEFKAGLAEGVPPLITVAHKFGEHSDEKTGEKQLHDCGIIYYPRHPYLLCIMTRGTSFEALDDSIASVSRIIFAEVDAQHRKEH